MSFTEEEMSDDLKHDILLAFNLYKSKENKINKLKLRTILFSFVMYKSSSSEINQFIEEVTSPDKEWFSYEEVCKMVFYKNKTAKDKEADEVYGYFLQGNKDNHHVLTEDDVQNGFNKYGVGASEHEIKEMVEYMLENEENTQNTEEESEEDEDEEQKKQRKKNKKINKHLFRTFYTAK